MTILDSNGKRVFKRSDPYKFEVFNTQAESRLHQLKSALKQPLAVSKKQGVCVYVLYPQGSSPPVETHSTSPLPELTLDNPLQGLTEREISEIKGVEGNMLMLVRELYLDSEEDDDGIRRPTISEIISHLEV